MLGLEFEDFLDFVSGIAYGIAWWVWALLVGTILLVTLPVWIVPYSIYKFVKWYKWYYSK